MSREIKDKIENLADYEVWLLARMSLVEEQADIIYNPEIRKNYGIKCTDKEIIENPYIVYEQTRRCAFECYIPVKKVDMAVFPPEEIRMSNLLLSPSALEVIEATKTNAGTRKLPMTEDVFRCFQAIIEDREKPGFEKIVDGHTGFLFTDKDGRAGGCQKGTIDLVGNSNGGGLLVRRNIGFTELLDAFSYGLYTFCMNSGMLVWFIYLLVKGIKQKQQIERKG